jgi:hypothetical protein
MRADPSRDTARLTQCLAPSCHDRPAGGLWDGGAPSTQMCATSTSYFGHVVEEVALAEGGVFCAADSGDPRGAGVPSPLSGCGRRARGAQARARPKACLCDVYASPATNRGRYSGKQVGQEPMQWTLSTLGHYVSLSFSIEQQTAYTPIGSQARVPRCHYRA